MKNGKIQRKSPKEYMTTRNLSNYCKFMKLFEQLLETLNNMS